MTLKLFRAVWFLSVLVVLANLLYVYASLPELVVVQETDPVSITREWLFYILMIGIVVVNLLVYLFKMIYGDEGENVRAWFHGLIITINLFLIISMHALNVYNSSEIFDHSRVSIFLGGSLVLIVIWAALWPVYLLVQKILFKQAV